MTDRSDDHVRIDDRRPGSFRYRRVPTAVMPVPGIPEKVVLPDEGIEDLFEIRLATTDREEQDAFAVRWQVYCRELGYEPGERFPDHREHDADDLRSVQVVAYHRPTRRPVACFRLLMCDPALPDSPFHVELVGSRLDPGSIPGGEARLGVCELSRFCIIAPFRRFEPGADLVPFGISAERWNEEAPRRRSLAGFLWVAAAHLALGLRLDYVLTLMEPRLALLGKTMGLAFAPIGSPVEFRGMRVPYRIDRRSLKSLFTQHRLDQRFRRSIAAWDARMQDHPMLVGYLLSRTSRVHRREKN